MFVASVIVIHYDNSNLKTRVGGNLLCKKGRAKLRVRVPGEPRGETVCPAIPYPHVRPHTPGRTAPWPRDSRSKWIATF
jgi:hypothetical protein